MVELGSSDYLIDNWEFCAESEDNFGYVFNKSLRVEDGLTLFEDSVIDSADEGVMLKLEKICRCCTLERNDLKPIVDSDLCVSALAILVSVTVSSNDGLPTKICCECHQKLEDFMIFKKQIHNAEELLRKCLENRQLFYDIQLHSPIVDRYLKEPLVEVINEEDGEESEKMEEYVVSSEKILQKLPGIWFTNREHLQRTDSKKIQENHSETEETSMPNIISIKGEEDCTDAQVKYLPTVNIEISVNSDNSVSTVVKDRLNGFECKVCKKTFQSKILFDRHQKCHFNMAEVDSDGSGTRTNAIPPDTSKEFRCRICNVFFTFASDLKIHNSIHRTDGKYVCVKCNKEFPNCIKLKRHIPIHYEDKPCKCILCGRGYSEMFSLTRHMRKHDGQKRNKEISCPVCMKIYPTRAAVDIHLRTHTGERPLVCTQCGKSFTNTRLLNSHMKTHSGEKNYACDQCGKRFTHYNTLVGHKRTHTGEKPYVCSVCHKSFIQSTNLAVHMRVHSGEKPYKCELCGRGFASASTLSTHIRTHTGEKPYQCPECGKSFARQDLTVHMRTHTGERPYKCTKCTKCFSTVGHLQHHIRTHTGEKPFSCCVCKKRFTNPTNMRIHMRMHEKRVREQSKKLDKDSSTDNAEHQKRIENKDENSSYKENHYIPNSEQEDLQSDVLFNENVVLVKDLLAAALEGCEFVTEFDMKVDPMTVDQMRNGNGASVLDKFL